MRGHVADLAAGGAIAVIGLYFAVDAFSYGIGTPDFAEPGFFPLIVGALAVAIGLLIIVKAMRHANVAFPAIAWRPITAVLAGVAVFSVFLTTLGFVPTIFLSVGVFALASNEARPVPTLILAAATTFVFWLIFMAGLGLQVSAFGSS